jgi:HAE1 family hydrophobic/amphiphilic exporter-1
MALLLSVTFVFLIMGVLFESFLLPMSIITTVPMAFLGVYWMLYLTDTSFDGMSGVGLVILVGVVVNNGIVYIDLATRLRNDGVDRLTALVDAGARRLRPILMTALTTIFGLVPMTIGDASFVGMPYAPLGRVVVGGLSTGTLLTLFLLPFLYTVLDDMRDTSRRWLAYLIGQKATSEVAK